MVRMTCKGDDYVRCQVALFQGGSQQLILNGLGENALQVMARERFGVMEDQMERGFLQKVLWGSLDPGQQFEG